MYLQKTERFFYFIIPIYLYIRIHIICTKTYNTYFNELLKLYICLNKRKYSLRTLKGNVKDIKIWHFKKSV